MEGKKKAKTSWWLLVTDTSPISAFQYIIFTTVMGVMGSNERLSSFIFIYVFIPKELTVHRVSSETYN